MAVKQKAEKLSKTKCNNVIRIKEKAKTTNDNKKRHILYHAFKRLIDIIIGIVGIIILIPMTVIVKIFNMINKENGPVFYKQKRIGKNGKYFYIYKYRSMCVGADEKLKKYLEEHPKEKEEFIKYRKLENDPRITKTGKFLRETSLDEVPQVINLLNGTMTLIGPRPIVDGEIEAYGDDKEKFLSVTPGLTGYWQVNGRSNTTYEERKEMELYYVEHQSLLLDLKIFFKTFAAVVNKDGAM